MTQNKKLQVGYFRLLLPTQKNEANGMRKVACSQGIATFSCLMKAVMYNFNNYTAMSTNRNEQLSKIRQHLLDGKTITPMEALNLYGCYHLSAIICILRRDEGLPIHTILPHATEGEPYAQYWLDSDYIQNHNKKI